MEKVKLIRGSKARTEEIQKILEECGGKNRYFFDLGDGDYYYYVGMFGSINRCYLDEGECFIEEGKAEIYELPPLKPKCELKPFDKVLVRDDSQSEWKGDLFTHMDKDGSWHICITGNWLYCIPYEGNEHLLGTTDNPK